MGSDSETGQKARKPSAFVYLAATSALMGAIGMGTVLGWSSPATASLAKNGSEPQVFDKTQDKAWILSSATVGALVGALASGPVAQKLGRKIALVIYGIPLIAGFVILWLAKSVGLLIMGRVLTGLSAGLISGTAPQYVVEISTENVRGLLGTGFQLCVTIGILLVYVFGAFMSWQWLSFVCIFPGLAMSLMMILMPETPIWLMTKAGGDHSKGSEVEKALRKLRDESNDNEGELNDISAANEEAAKSKGFSMEERKNPLFYKPFVLSLFLMIFQQFSGINAVMFNSTKILEDAGSTLEAKYGSIVIGVAQVFATLVGALLVDRLGRKKLLIGSGVGHVVSLGVLGIYYVAKIEAGWLPVVCLIVFIISFSLGWGPIPWLMIAEITPMQFRSMISAIATGVNWTCAFLITHNFEAIQSNTSAEFTFFGFAVFSLISIPFVIMFLPETKGKPFDEILRSFTKDNVVSEQSTPSASNAMLRTDNKGNVAGLNGSDNKIEMKAFNEKTSQ